jgi:hypothetical protein
MLGQSASPHTPCEASTLPTVTTQIGDLPRHWAANVTL